MMPFVRKLQSFVDDSCSSLHSNLPVYVPCLKAGIIWSSEHPFLFLWQGVTPSEQQVMLYRLKAEFTMQQASTLWFNMREEVLVYVKGRPLVLREDERPFKNMQVCTPSAWGHCFSGC